MPRLASACARAPRASRPGRAPCREAAPSGGACPDRDVDGAYRELRATVARGLAYRTGSSDLAEDLTQDVFVDLLVAARCRPPVEHARLARARGAAARCGHDRLGRARARGARATGGHEPRARPSARRSGHRPRDPGLPRAALRAAAADHRAPAAAGPLLRALRPHARHERGRGAHALPAGAACAAARAGPGRGGGTLMARSTDVAPSDVGRAVRAARLVARLRPGEKEEIVLRLLRDSREQRRARGDGGGAAGRAQGGGSGWSCARSASLDRSSRSRAC